MLERLLQKLYEVLSFECGEDFKENEFKNLFISNAVLMECYENKIKHKTLDEHIHEFRSAMKAYPQLFKNGFHEKQLEYNYIENENSILVSSKYQKIYCRDEKEVTEYGINNIVIIKENNHLKIVSILW